MREFFKGWRRKIGCVALVAAFPLAGWCIVDTVNVELTRVDVGENVPSVSWLPKSASNVSFYKSYSYTAYEFDIPESEFVTWSRWQLSPITEPVHVLRHCFFRVRAMPSPEASATYEEWKAYEELRSTAGATISEGLYYEHVQSNGGGVHVAFDRKKGRAFFQSAPR